MALENLQQSGNQIEKAGITKTGMHKLVGHGTTCGYSFVRSFITNIYLAPLQLRSAPDHSTAKKISLKARVELFVKMNSGEQSQYQWKTIPNRGANYREGTVLPFGSMGKRDKEHTPHSRSKGSSDILYLGWDSKDCAGMGRPYRTSAKRGRDMVICGHLRYTVSIGSGLLSMWTWRLQQILS